MPRIPQNLTLEEIQQAFRDVHAKVDPLLIPNVDLQGRRIQGAGKAIAPRDYITKQELDTAIIGLRPVSAPVRVAIAAGTATTPTPTNTLPPPNHPMDFGYYFVDGKYGQFANEVRGFTNLAYIGPNNMLAGGSSPSDIAVALGAGIARLASAGIKIILDVETGALITIGDALLAAQPNWASVKYVVFNGSIDRGRASMNTEVNAVKQRISNLGLAPKPVGVVNDGVIFEGDGHLADALDFVVIEAYPKSFTSHGTSADNIAAIKASVNAMKSQIPGSKRVGLIMAAYTQSGNFTPVVPDLVDLQSATYLMCNTDVRVDILLMFAYGRPSGTRDNAPLKPIHQQIGSMVTGTTGGTGSPGGGPTCGGAGLPSNCKRFCIGGTWDFNVDVAQRESIQAHPEWFADPSFSIPFFVDDAAMNAYMSDVVTRLIASGVAAQIGTTDFGQLWVQAASNPDFSDGYAIVTGSRQVRFNPGAYRATCSPAQF